MSTGFRCHQRDNHHHSAPDIPDYPPVPQTLWSHLQGSLSLYTLLPSIGRTPTQLQTPIHQANCYSFTLKAHLATWCQQLRTLCLTLVTNQTGFCSLHFHFTLSYNTNQYLICICVCEDFLQETAGTAQASTEFYVSSASNSAWHTGSLGKGSVG